MLLCLLFLCVSGAWGNNVTVIRMQMEFDVEHTLSLDNTIEYVLDFVPNEEQRSVPSVVWLSSEGADATTPMLVTARMRTGAVTWQLPYSLGDTMMYELERTLCEDGDAPEDSHCVSGAGNSRGSFSLHASSSCAARAALRVRAQPARPYRLRALQPHDIQGAQTSPRVLHYTFEEDQRSVLLRAESLDSVCVTVSVHNHSTCPVPQTVSEAAAASAPRLTMQRAGAMQIHRSSYPLGFYIVVVVHENDLACTGGEPDPDQDQDWLWETAIFGEREENTPLPRNKVVTITMQSTLSRSGYAIASSVTLAIFAAFYVAFAALVLAQRWQPLAKLVKPKAVLADPETNEETQTDAPARRQRRTSTATYDSSDLSDTDSEYEAEVANRAAAGHVTENVPDADGRDPARVPDARTVTVVDGRTPGVTESSPGVITSQEGAGNGTAVEQNGQQTQGRAAPALRLAALSRRGARVLGARSDRYLHTLLIVAVFYALPVVQFVSAFQILLNVSGSLDICYYNFLCAHPLGNVSDFNHVFSNAGYLLLGALFLLQLRRRRTRRRRQPRHEEYGIPAHYGLLAALGAGMMVVALLSATYHICPNRLNFQFDTAFMYVLSVVAMVKIYQARHPDVNARAHATFGVLAVLIAIVVWGVLGGGPGFWAAFTLLHVFTMLMLSLRIYYLGQFRLESRSLAAAARATLSGRPLYTGRLVMLLLANLLNWAFALYGLVQQPADFASHLLQVLLGNTLLYMCAYLAMKLLSGERLRWYAWAFLAGAALAWAPALYFFTWGSSMWSEPPASSREYNHSCLVLQFYDSHDLWHFLSAVALYLSFNAMLTWDDGLSAVKRTDIVVF